jgi:predicted GIY-YIG superfamily endonuclease
MPNYSGRKIKTPAAYTLTHIPTGKFYIGSSKDVHARISRHKYNLNQGIHVTSELQNTYTGWDDMEVAVFETNTVEEALQMEQHGLDCHLGSSLCCNHYSEAENTRSENKQAVSINGVIYGSISDAAKALNIKHQHLCSRLNRTYGKYKDWHKLT